VKPFTARKNQQLQFRGNNYHGFRIDVSQLDEPAADQPVVGFDQNTIPLLSAIVNLTIETARVVNDINLSP
jgi:hypothetical protein